MSPFYLNINELPYNVRDEVQKPFQGKLERAIQLITLWSKVNSYVSCSFGKDSMVLLYLARQIKPDIPVVYVNTGVDYPETVAFKNEILQAWNLNLFEIRPNTTFFKVMDKVKAKGNKVDDGSKQSNICCYHLKEKPLLQFQRLHGFTHCFTGITAMESRKRAYVACQLGQEYYTKKQEIWKIHPIIYWSPDEVMAFIKDRQIPVNPVYAKYGLHRTGCMCCTCHRRWREELGRVNPKLYKIIMERYFDQKVF